VAPFSIAAGIQNKILEAMAFELPVVATPKTVQGLVGPVARVVRTADDEHRFAETSLELLRNPDEARRIGREGRLRVSEEYDWSVSLQRLVELVERPDGRSNRETRQTSTERCSAAVEH
jgi:glycosyltransferase involved in cell wall biosynthesis